MRVIVLLGLIGVGIAVAITVWLLRYSPLGEPGPIGSPPGSDSPPITGWQEATSAPFGRLEMAVAALDGRVWLVGGLDAAGTALVDVDIFDPATREWESGPPLPTALHHAALATDGEVLLLAGGYDGSSFGAPTAATHILDPASGEWADGPALPAPRGAGALAHDGDRFVYAGGVGPGGVADEIYALVDLDQWEASGALTRPREHLAATSDGSGTTWFLGGRQGGLETNLGDVDVVVADDVRASTPLSPRGGVAAFFAPGIGACLTGGEAPTRAFTIVECVSADDRQTALPRMAQPRHGHGAAVVDGVAYVLLGGSVPGLDVTSTVEMLDLDD